MEDENVASDFTNLTSAMAESNSNFEDPDLGNQEEDGQPVRVKIESVTLSDEETLFCCYCNEMWDTERELLLHLVMNHRKHLNIEYLCQLCGLGFPSTTKVRQHADVCDGFPSATKVRQHADVCDGFPSTTKVRQHADACDGFNEEQKEQKPIIGKVELGDFPEMRLNTVIKEEKTESVTNGSKIDSDESQSNHPMEDYSEDADMNPSKTEPSDEWDHESHDTEDVNLDESQEQDGEDFQISRELAAKFTDAQGKILKNSKLYVAENGRFKCLFCHKTFKILSSASRHARVHINGYPYKCLTCGKGFHTSSELNRHFVTHINAERAKNIVSFHPDSAQLQEQLTEDVNSTQKEMLSRSLPVTSQEMDTRISSAELGEQLAPGVEEQGKIYSYQNGTYVCCICTMSFKNAAKADRHAKEHIHMIDGLPYKCKECPKAYRAPSDLARHMASHIKVKPFACNVCGKSYKIKASLLGHSLIHKKYCPYACSMCTDRFKDEESLAIHVSQHAVEDIFTCHICKKTCADAAALQVHISRHKLVYPVNAGSAGSAGANAVQVDAGSFGVNTGQIARNVIKEWSAANEQLDNGLVTSDQTGQSTALQQMPPVSYKPRSFPVFPEQADHPSDHSITTGTNVSGENIPQDANMTNFQNDYDESQSNHSMNIGSGDVSTNSSLMENLDDWTHECTEEEALDIDQYEGQHGEDLLIPSELAAKFIDGQGKIRKKLYVIQNGRYKCRFCVKSFKLLKSANRHGRVHIRGYACRCHLCGKGFHGPSELRRHLKTHEGSYSESYHSFTPGASVGEENTVNDGTMQVQEEKHDSAVFPVKKEHEEQPDEFNHQHDHPKSDLLFTELAAQFEKT